MMGRVLRGLGCRNYRETAALVPEVFGLSASTVSRRFIRASAKKLQALMERDLSGHDLVALFLDGKSFGEDEMVIAVGVTIEGKKVVLGMVETASENATVCREFLKSLVERGLRFDEGLLAVLDGAKGFHRAVREVFGRAAVIQRCRWHKRENVLKYLPESRRSVMRRKLQAAYVQLPYEQAKVALKRVRSELALMNQSAAKSLDEGLEQTLTLHRLGYSRSDLVLDIGSGHRPHPRADVLCDRSLVDDQERGSPLVRDRPLVAGVLTALPFKDRSMDFVICQHVLEHVHDAESALRELMRVGKSGYIETPAPLWEKLVGRPYHHWLIERRGQRLVCVAKPTRVPCRDLLPCFDGFSRSGVGWQVLTFEHFDSFYTTLHWRGLNDYRIETAEPVAEIGDVQEAPTSAADPAEGAPESGSRRIIRNALLALARLIVAPRRRHFDLNSIVACPACHGALVPVAGELQCAQCRLAYPLRDGVPMLLLSEAAPCVGSTVGSGSRPTRGERASLQ